MKNNDSIVKERANSSKVTNKQDDSLESNISKVGGETPTTSTVRKVVNRNIKSNINPTATAQPPTNKFMASVIACRPWSLTAGSSSVLVGTALAYRFHNTFDEFTFAIVMTGAIATQIFGNLVNSYCDFVNGVDHAETSADRTMFDLGLTPSYILKMMMGSLVCALACLITLVVKIPFDVIVQEMLPLVLMGTLLTIAYTASPFSLKYRGLGDLVIVTCFGPLIVQGSFIAQTHFKSDIVYLYSVPLALIIEAILHINNTRDIETDKKAKAVTIANILGHDLSTYFFSALYLVAYLIQYYIAMREGNSFINLPLLLVPKIIYNLVPKFSKGEWEGLDATAGQFALFFGGLSTIAFIFAAP